MPELRSWNDTETTEAIVAFAEGAAQTVPPEERIAVFDNDGTLWCEKLRHLEAHGFTCFIASGGSRDFMRTVTGEVYGIPPERVVGSSFGLEYVDDEHGGSLAYLAQPDVFVHTIRRASSTTSRAPRRRSIARGAKAGRSSA